MPLLLKGVLCLHPMQDKAIHRPEVMTLRHLHHLFLNPYYTKSHPSSHADFNFIQMLNETKPVEIFQQGSQLLYQIGKRHKVRNRRSKNQDCKPAG